MVDHNVGVSTVGVYEVKRIDSDFFTDSGGGSPLALEIAISLPMNEFFLSALSFGLAAGLKPGPLGVIVIQQTLSRGLPAGVRASLAPLVTDGPIIIAALWFLSWLTDKSEACPPTLLGSV